MFRKTQVYYLRDPKVNAFRENGKVQFVALGCTNSVIGPF